MMLPRQFAVGLVALGVLFGFGCEKQKPQLPPKMQAPTITESVPDRIPEIAPAPIAPAPQQEVAVEEPAPKKAPPKRKNAKKPAPAPAANQAAPVVATNHPPASPPVDSPAPDPAIAAANSQQLNWQKQTTTELLDAVEKDIKNLNRGLTHDEDVMLAQIRSYIAQSRKATSDGDFERAYNLAKKAQLLSDALVKK